MQNLTPFVGREKELKELKRHFDEALNYNGSFVLIGGETGVGKIRLLETGLPYYVNKRSNRCH